MVAARAFLSEEAHHCMHDNGCTFGVKTRTFSVCGPRQIGAGARGQHALKTQLSLDIGGKSRWELLMSVMDPTCQQMQLADRSRARMCASDVTCMAGHANMSFHRHNV